MKCLSSRPIIYFSIGLFAGSNLGYLLEFNDKYRMEINNFELDQLIILLVYLLIWGVMLGGLTVLLSRGLALVFLIETKKPNAIHKPED